MTAEEHKLRKERFARIRFLKKILRPLPRRATLHRYPILKSFAKTARKRSYLWSFRVKEAVPAIYIGCIITLLPIYGLQVILAFFVALRFRTNLMILMALQLVSNPITLGPLWYANYAVGDFFLTLFLTNSEATSLAVETVQSVPEMHITDNENTISRFLHLYGSISLGGLIIGYFAGFVLSFIYQFAAKRASESYQSLLNKSAQRKTRSQHNENKSVSVPNTPGVNQAKNTS